MGSLFRELRRWEMGRRSGMVTEDSETFRLDNLESEVVGGASVLYVVAYGTVEFCRDVTLWKAT
jgi:hypothetical protein